MNEPNTKTEMQALMQTASRVSQEIENLRGTLSRIAADETVNDNTIDACATLDELLNKSRAQLISQAFRVLASHYPPPPEAGEQWKQD